MVLVAFSDVATEWRESADDVTWLRRAGAMSMLIGGGDMSTRSVYADGAFTRCRGRVDGDAMLPRRTAPRYALIGARRG